MFFLSFFSLVCKRSQFAKKTWRFANSPVAARGVLVTGYVGARREFAGTGPARQSRRKAEKSRAEKWWVWLRLEAAPKFRRFA